MRLTNKWSTLSLAILRFTLPAQVVKLVDTLASGASARKGVEVQVLSWAPNFSLTLKVSRTRPREGFQDHGACSSAHAFDQPRDRDFEKRVP